tara:strand:+ start:38 stop:580 length:543 start_codon:yes stop_codon:yes gene_type:complete
MSYTCTKVNSVSSEVAESFWSGGEPYYITEGTLPKWEGSDAANYANFIDILTIDDKVECLYVVSLNDYPVVIVPAHDDGDKIRGEMILVRPDTTNSRAFLYTENGVWSAFVNFWKTEGYTALHGPAFGGLTMYEYLKAGCESGIMPCSFTDEPYAALNSYLPMFVEDTPEFRWITFTFNE